MKNIEIYCHNTRSKHSYPLGTSLLEISRDLDIKMKNTVCGAIVNHQVRELSFCLVKPKQVEFFDVSHPDGIRMYIRSLIFVLYAAVKEVYPHVSLRIQKGISNGYFCELTGFGREITDKDIELVKAEMKEIIAKEIPFIKRGLLTEDAVEHLMQEGLEDKAQLFEQQGHLFTSLYFLENLGNYFYGHLLPSTNYISNFNLEKYFDGLLLRIPDSDNFDKLMEAPKQKKLFEIYEEHKDWAQLLNVSTISNLNEFTLKKQGGDIIKIAEALHEKKIAEIANIIHSRNSDIKVVLVAGPSASGKTTFSKRLGVQLAVNGLHPYQISLDNYFVDREHTPRDEHGNYDFEALDAIDIGFFNEQLLELFRGKEVQLPKFDFHRGRRYLNGDKLRLKHGDILIVEGIHGMNPRLLTDVQEKNTFKIFISALTQISFDEHTHISTSDNRLTRRIIRDSKYRGYGASETIKRWPSVRRGEEKNIFPYQENADVMFNSATLYELAVLKKYAEPLLKQVLENQPEYMEAMRLLKFLSYFKPIDDNEIPPTSLLREFLGGSSFVY
ncbi:uridine kinase [Tangfeifania diversioriginum]|uniref:Uridine kinase n=1 Tax=Tangfeifania diversioriginum TaxID=1168035 RepID=A0A1M6JSI7_9BACT|nr:nucleoside kinase [Tangfeifania diversioriginum]SHJ49633.1 uridine kinase [Tangfeifania diversioriginum]